MPALRGPDGKIIYVSDSDARKYIAGGDYTPVSEAAAGAESSTIAPEDTGIIGGVKAGLSAGLSGATLGLSDLALRGIQTAGQTEQLASERAAHPYISGLAQTAGAVLPAVVSGGAATPSGYLSKLAGEAISAGQETGGALGAAQGLAAAGAEGSLQNAGIYLSDVALGDRDLSAEGITGALGTGFEFGVGGALAAHGVEAGTIAARRMFARYAEGGKKAAEEAAQKWMASKQSSLEAFDQTADMARARLAEAQAARQKATAELEGALTPEIGAAELPPPPNALPPDAAAHIFQGEGLDLATNLSEYTAARKAFDEIHARVDPDLEASLQNLGEVGLQAEPAPSVPVGEFGAPGARGVKTPDELAAIAAGTPPGEVPTSALRGNQPAPVAEPTRVLRGGGAAGEVTPPMRGPMTPTDFDSYRKSFVDSIPKEEVDAAKAYSGGSHASINRGLRGNRELSDLAAGRVKLLDSMMERSAAPTEMTVLRGENSENTFQRLSKLKPGDVYTDKGFLSTTVAESVPREFEGNVELKITIPKGAQAAPIPALKSGEREILLPRNQQYRVDSIESIPNPTRKGKQRLVVNVTAISAEAPSDLMTQLGAMAEQLNAGKSLKQLSAESPARAEYVATKALKKSEAAQHFREQAKKLEMQYDATIEVARTATNPAERAAASAEAKALGEQITALAKRPTAVDDIAKLAGVITRVEKAAANLTESVGEIAPAAAKEHATAFRAAEDNAQNKVLSRIARAADDATSPPVSIGARKATLRKAQAAENSAAAAVKAAEEARAAAAAERQPVAEPPTATPSRTSSIGAKIATGATAVGIASDITGDLGIPGIPRPHDIPVIGPLLSAYLKYRALRAVMGRFAGRVPATAETRAAALAARTKDAVARGVDRALGIIESSPQTVRQTVTAASLRVNEALSKRAFNDGQPDAPNGASVSELAATRMREIAYAATNPQAVIDLVRQQTRDVTDPALITALENHLTAMFQHLNDTAPKGPPPNPYTKKEWVPSQAEALQWGRRLAVANDPTVAIDALHAQTLTPDAAETLRVVKPLLFAQAQQRLIERAADLKNPVPYSQLARNSVLFDVPLHISQEPDTIAVLATAHSSIPQPPPQGGTQPMASIANSTNLSQLYQPDHGSSRR